jgi:hypothetical protein
MKKVVMCKPFGEIKSYSICLEDNEKTTLTPLLYIRPSSFLSDEEYHNLVAELKISSRPDYIPLIQELDDDGK